jgi:hypothetical protein
LPLTPHDLETHLALACHPKLVRMGWLDANPSGESGDENIALEWIGPQRLLHQGR